MKLRLGPMTTGLLLHFYLVLNLTPPRLAYTPAPFVTLRQKQQNEQLQRLLQRQQAAHIHRPYVAATSSTPAPPIELQRYGSVNVSTIANTMSTTSTTAAPSSAIAMSSLRPGKNHPATTDTTTLAPSTSTPSSAAGEAATRKGQHKKGEAKGAGMDESRAPQPKNHHHSKGGSKGGSRTGDTSSSTRAPKSHKVAHKEEEQTIDQLQIQSGEDELMPPLPAITTENPLDSTDAASLGDLSQATRHSLSIELPTIDGGSVPGDEEGGGEDGDGGDGGTGHDSDEAPTQPLKKVAGRKGKGGGSRRGGGGTYGKDHGLPLTPMENSIATMLRCQDLDTREMIPSATACRNTRSDKVCAYLFMEVDLRTGRRDVKCNLQGLEDIAESCRRTCGICCEDINYSCEDDNNGIIDCGRQLDKCHINKWFGVLSRFCAGSCGLCARTSCRDYDNTCRVRKSLCLKEETVDYMRENCARTCGFCVVGDLYPGGADSALSELIGHSVSGGVNGNAGMLEPAPPSPSSPQAGLALMSMKPVKSAGGGVKSVQHRGSSSRLHHDCKDIAENCTHNEELCTSPLYSEYMVKYCTKTCLKCQPGDAGQSHSHRPVPTEPLNDALGGVKNAYPKHAMRSSPLGAIAALEGTMIAAKGGRRGGCEDRHPKCKLWTRNGFCANEKYTRPQRQRLCARSCKLC